MREICCRISIDGVSTGLPPPINQPGLRSHANTEEKQVFRQNCHDLNRSLEPQGQAKPQTKHLIIVVLIPYKIICISLDIYNNVCLRSSDPFHVVTYQLKWVTTSWTLSSECFHLYTSLIHNQPWN